MPEKPKQEDSSAQGNKQKDTRWGKVKKFFHERKGFWGTGWRNFKEYFGDNPILKFFRDNPTLVLSLLYLYVTGIGLVYSYVLYRHFGINIVDYSEITDFLLAAFKNPATLIYLGVQVVLTLLNLYFVIAGEGRSRGTTLNAILTGILIFVVLPVGFSVATGRDTASSIKDGETPEVDVQYRSFSSSAGQVTEPGLQLIGSTQKVVFFYDENNKRTVVIPQPQIVSIEVPE